MVVLVGDAGIASTMVCSKSYIWRIRMACLAGVLSLDTGVGWGLLKTDTPLDIDPENSRP
jgi:hypothetical protein